MPTKIEWVQNPDGTKGESWNPVTGCTKVSEGCRNCYAERMAKRLAGRFGYSKIMPFSVSLHWDKLSAPEHWRKPRVVFVCSMGDLFHHNVPEAYIYKMWLVMERCSRHTFIVLTKRPHWMKAWVEGWGLKPLPNVWLGVSVENQARADERIPLLLAVPAAVRFISLEPLLGPVDLGFGPSPDCLWCSGTGEWYADTGGMEVLPVTCECMTRNRWLSWAIVGGESGPRARPMNPDWARSVRDQCQEAGVSFFMKQMAKRAPIPDDLMIREYPEGRG